MSREFPKNPEPKIALPTVGRVVHVFGNWEPNVHPDTPRVGIVAGVSSNNPLVINAAVWASDGSMDPAGVQRIMHVSVRDEAVRNGISPQYWWDWMDYQKGQAAKTEQLERDLGKLQAGAPSPVDGKR